MICSKKNLQAFLDTGNDPHKNFVRVKDTINSILTTSARRQICACLSGLHIETNGQTFVDLKNILINKVRLEPFLNSQTARLSELKKIIIIIIMFL
jgi:hypothetical protein